MYMYICYYLCYTNYSIYYINLSVSNNSNICIWYVDKVYTILYTIVWPTVSHTPLAEESLQRSPQLQVRYPRRAADVR